MQEVQMKLLGPFSALARFFFHEVVKHFKFQLIQNPTSVLRILFAEC